MSSGKNCCRMKTRLYFLVIWRQRGGKLGHIAVEIKRFKVRMGALHVYHKHYCSRV